MSATTVDLSLHAIERFQQRMRPALTLAAAEEELAELMALGEIVGQPPDWFARRQLQHAPCYLVVGDFVLPLVPARYDPEVLCATTCVARGGLSDKARERRNSHRRRRNRSGQGRVRHGGSAAAA